MPIEVRALPEAEYKAWLETAREEFAMNDKVPTSVKSDVVVLAAAD